MKRANRLQDGGNREFAPITEILPHRVPFLFLSRIISMQNNLSAIAEYDVPLNHPFFEGHFPKRPILPGVIILEIMAQTGALAILGDKPKRGQVVYLAGIETARFKKIVEPGQVVRANVEIQSLRMGIGKARGEAFVADDQVAYAQMVFALSV